MKKKFIFFLISNILLSIANWFQLMAVSKHLDGWSIGAFTLSLAITNPIFQLASLQLRPLLVTANKEGGEFNVFYSLRLLTVCIAILFTLIIAFFYNEVREDFYIILFLVALSAGIDALIDIFNAKQHAEEQFRIISVSNILKSGAIFLACFIGLFFLKNLKLALVLICLFKFLSFIFYDYRYWKQIVDEKLKLIFDKRLYTLFLLGLPLGINLLISSLNVNVSKYIVADAYGIEIQGVYSSISYLIVLGTLFIATMGQLFLPKLSSFSHKKDRLGFMKLTNKYVFLSLLVGLSLLCMSIFFGEFILKICFNDEVAKSSRLFSFLMFSSIFVYLASANGYCLTAMKELKAQPIICGISLIVNISAALLLNRLYGLEGITLAMGIAFAVQFILGSLVMRIKHKTVWRAS